MNFKIGVCLFGLLSLFSCSSMQKNEQAAREPNQVVDVGGKSIDRAQLLNDNKVIKNDGIVSVITNLDDKYSYVLITGFAAEYLFKSLSNKLYKQEINTKYGKNYKCYYRDEQPVCSIPIKSLEKGSF